MEKFNSLKIKELIRIRNISQKEFSEKIGITEGGLQYIFKTNSTKRETLERISDILQIPISYFFDDNKESLANNLNEPDMIYINGKLKAQNSNVHFNSTEENYVNELAALRRENELLKKIIEEKEEIIRLLKERK